MRCKINTMIDITIKMLQINNINRCSYTYIISIHVYNVYTRISVQRFTKLNIVLIHKFDLWLHYYISNIIDCYWTVCTRFLFIFLRRFLRIHLYCYVFITEEGEIFAWVITTKILRTRKCLPYTCQYMIYTHLYW